MKLRLVHSRAVLFAGALCLSPALLAAQEPPAGIRWDNQTELSFVSTGGNKSTNTLGAKSTLIGKSGLNTFKVEGGGIRGESTVTTRTATGTTENFTLREITESELTAASYFARARYDRALSNSFLFTGVGWDRNTFAGVSSRVGFVLGLGKTWVDSDTKRFKVDLGATYTIQKDVEPAPNADEGFGGARISLDAVTPLSATSDYATILTIDQNVEDTEDRRADWTNSITVALSARLALKTSLQLLFDNQPSLLRVPLVDDLGAPTGGRVATPGARVDNVLTLTLVIRL